MRRPRVRDVSQFPCARLSNIKRIQMAEITIEMAAPEVVAMTVGQALL